MMTKMIQKTSSLALSAVCAFGISSVGQTHQALAEMNAEAVCSLFTIPEAVAKCLEAVTIENLNLAAGGDNTITTMVTTIQTVGQPSTTSTRQATPAPKGDAQALLSAHNTVRQRHGAAPMQWSAPLAAEADAWAKGCAFQHGSTGENLAVWTGNRPASAAVDMWYGEVGLYDYANPAFSPQSGHFTQVVWDASRELGCGTASCPGLGTYVVCRYRPAGNMRGAFGQNVLPLR